ncbi:putative S-adenosyl-L-methionine-dependent methyltransferase [Helianthus annuus]|nr:putative S-adenosyl-L-methionine-dependent methyltransferase [Helianthus annuus]
MAVDSSTFETLTPSQFITFTLPNTINPHHHRCHLHTPLLRIAVLDSPIATTDDPNPIIAAMIVPDHRETDWNFCTESGHLQLLYDFSNISRLILIVVERFVGPFVGEFLVEDVQLENKEFRRRLRFKRMPNLIQSQVPVVASVCNVELGLVSLEKMKKVEFRVDTGTLVQPYLTPMVSGLFLIVSSVNDRIQRGFSPRALCLGVGGGALLSFLNSKLGFEVVGVEADEVVLSVARGYFGLTDGKSVKLIVGDAIKSLGSLNDKFDVVMVDLDSSEARSGTSAPPLEFVKKPVFRALRSLVYSHGVIVINVISPNELFYETLVQQLQDVFHKVYAMDVKNDGNIVLMATVSPIAANDHDCAFSKRLRAVVSGSYMESIVEL